MQHSKRKEMKMKMKKTIKICKWGNSAAIRIPMEFVKMLKLEKDDEIVISHFCGKIVIEKATIDDPTLEEMMVDFDPL